MAIDGRPVPPSGRQPQQIRLGDTSHGASTNNSGLQAGNAYNSILKGQEFTIHGDAYFGSPNILSKFLNGHNAPRAKADEKSVQDEYTDAVLVARKWEAEQKYSQALALYDIIFSSLREELSPWNPATLSSACDIARILEKLGKLETALLWYSEICFVRKSVLGSDAEETLEAAHFSAKILERQGNLPAALSWYGDIFRVRFKKRGKSDKKTLKGAIDVSRILEKQGERNTSLEWYADIQKVIRNHDKKKVFQQTVTEIEDA